MTHHITPISEIPSFVKGEIYLIRNIITGGSYIGQTRTHILNHAKFRPFGSHKRWIQHVSEAIGEYKHQSMKLNNAIRKYGKDAFIVVVLEICDIDELNTFENLYIEGFNTVQNGYNLTNGGDKQVITEIGKQNIANTLIKHYADKKFKKFEGLAISSILLTLSVQPDMMIVKLYAKYAVGATIKQKIVDFGGKKCKIEESAERAYEFASKLTQTITIHPKLQVYLKR